MPIQWRDLFKKQDRKLTKDLAGFRDVPRWLYDKAGEMQDSLLEPIVNLEPVGRWIDEQINTPYRSYRPSESLTEKDLSKASVIEKPFEKLAGVLSPTGLDVATLGGAKGISAVKKPIKEVTEQVVKKPSGVQQFKDFVSKDLEQASKRAADAVPDVAAKKPVLDPAFPGSGSAAISPEEGRRAARGEVYYKVGRGGEVTYFGPQPDPTGKGLRQGEGIIRIENGKPVVSQASGTPDSEILARFNKSEVSKQTGKSKPSVQTEDIYELSDDIGGLEDFDFSQFKASIGTPDDPEDALIMSFINKFAGGEIDKNALVEGLKSAQVSPQKIQGLLLKHTGIKPREVGLDARSLTMNPRFPDPATNPRAVGDSPRQRKLQAEFKDVTGGNVEYPDDEELISLKSLMGMGDEDTAKAAAVAAKTEKAVESKPAIKIDPEALPDKIPKSYVQQFAKDNNLSEEAVETVLRQRYKQQQVRKARSAFKAQKQTTSQPAATLNPQQSQQWANLQAKYGGAPSAPSSSQAARSPGSAAPSSGGIGSFSSGAGTPPNPPSSSGLGTPSSGGPGGGGFGQKQLARKASFWENILGTPKTLKSVIDQPIGRQGIVQALAHPSLGLDAFKSGLKSYTKPGFDEVMSRIENSPRFDVMKEYGILDPDVAQQFPATWPEQIPGIEKIVRGSEQNYVGSLDTLRAGRFNQLADKVEQNAAQQLWGNQLQGPLNLGPEYEAIAEMVGDTTGKGKVPGLQDYQSGKLARLLNATFYSPRFRASSFSLLNPVNYTNAGKYGSPSGIPLQEFRKDMAKYGAGVGTGLLGASQLGGDVELDPRSSDFLQAQFGNTRMDMTRGMRPIINMAARSAAGLFPNLPTMKSSKTDKFSEANIPDPKNPIASWGTNFLGNTLANATHYARTGLAPGIPTGIGDLTLGKERTRQGPKYKNVVGEEVHPFSLDYGLDQITPMFPEGVVDAWKDLGPASIPLSALGFLGLGENTFGLDNGNTKTNTSYVKDTSNSDKHRPGNRKRSQRVSRSSSKKPRRSY